MAIWNTHSIIIIYEPYNSIVEREISYENKNDTAFPL